MKHTCTTDLTESSSSVAVHRLKITDFSVTQTTARNSTDCIKSRCAAGGYDWEVRFYPARSYRAPLYFSALQLVFLAGARTPSVTADLTMRLLDHRTSGVQPIELRPTSKTFTDPSDLTFEANVATGDVRDNVPGSLTVECTIAVRSERKAIPLPCSDLRHHLGELLESEAGADVTFSVSGESFAAHRSILAARSPVFMAEFFGTGAAMAERSSCVEIRDMDGEVFRAMLRFVYTDAVPEFEERPEAETMTAMAQRLLVAADRYGMERLKVMCEGRLSLGISVGTAASTLALAEQLNCSQLKDDCVEFIAGGSPENLDAVLATEGYRQLEANSPSVLTELLKKAVHGRKSKVTEGS